MQITVVADANPIISALIGGTSREIFFDRRFGFITSEFTMKEVKKYIPVIAQKLEMPIHHIEIALALLPISIYRKEFYKSKIKKAETLIARRDKKDVEILALTLATNNPLWSQDKHFEDISQIKLLKTKDLL